MSQSHKLFCRAMLDECEQYVNPHRAKLGYMTCMKCGESIAKQRKFTVAIPYSKGAYQLINNPKDLFHTNPKRTT